MEQPKFQNQLEKYEYVKNIKKNPPPHMEKYRREDVIDSDKIDYRDIQGVNAYQGIVTRDGEQYNAWVRYGNNTSKGGFQVCLKMSDYKWDNIRPHRDDKYGIDELLMDDSEEFAYILVCGGAFDSFDGEGWYRFDIIKQLSDISSIPAFYQWVHRTPYKLRSVALDRWNPRLTIANKPELVPHIVLQMMSTCGEHPGNLHHWLGYYQDEISDYMNFSMDGAQAFELYQQIFRKI